MTTLFHDNFRTVLAAAVLGLIWTGCDTNAENPGGGEQELITQVTLVLTPVGSGATVTAVAVDSDFDGQWNQIDSLRLQAGTTYDGTITLRDVPNSTDITQEIAEEAESHQFFYAPTGNVSSVLNVAVTDRESDYGGMRSNPVGIDFSVSTSSAPGATGGLRVRLGHFEGGADEKNGTNQGETDLDVTFPVRVTP